MPEISAVIFTILPTANIRAAAAKLFFGKCGKNGWAPHRAYSKQNGQAPIFNLV